MDGKRVDDYLGFPYKGKLIDAWAEPGPDGKFVPVAEIEGRRVPVGATPHDSEDEAARHALGDAMNAVDEGDF